jgi:hypothetical protein
MKINYSTYPILKDLFNESIDSTYLHEGDRESFINYKDSLDVEFKNINSEFIKNIFYVSEPFMDSVLNASKKIYEIEKKIIEDPKTSFEFYETYIRPKSGNLLHIKKILNLITIKFFWFDKNGGILAYYSFCKHGTNIWMSKRLNEGKDKEKIVNNAVNVYMDIYFFKKYADVETKLLAPNQKIKLDTGIKHKNETQLPITYLDSKWFTNLVQSNAFNVRGHLRLQPKIKNGQWIKDPIWIHDFMKHGYTSRAKILTQDIDHSKM